MSESQLNPMYQPVYKALFNVIRSEDSSLNEKQLAVIELENLYRQLCDIAHENLRQHSSSNSENLAGEFATLIAREIWECLHHCFWTTDDRNRGGLLLCLTVAQVLLNMEGRVNAQIGFVLHLLEEKTPLEPYHGLLAQRMGELIPDWSKVENAAERLKALYPAFRESEGMMFGLLALIAQLDTDFIVTILEGFSSSAERVAVLRTIETFPIAHADLFQAVRKTYNFIHEGIGVRDAELVEESELVLLNHYRAIGQATPNVLAALDLKPGEMQEDLFSLLDDLASGLSVRRMYQNLLKQLSDALGGGYFVRSEDVPSGTEPGDEYRLYMQSNRGLIPVFNQVGIPLERLMTLVHVGDAAVSKGIIPLWDKAIESQPWNEEISQEPANEPVKD